MNFLITKHKGFECQSNNGQAQILYFMYHLFWPLKTLLLSFSETRKHIFIIRLGSPTTLC